MIVDLADYINGLHVKTMLVALPDGDVSLKSVSIDTFYNMLKECERELGLTPQDEDSCTDGVSGD